MHDGQTVRLHKSNIRIIRVLETLDFRAYMTTLSRVKVIRKQIRINIVF